MHTGRHLTTKTWLLALAMGVGARPAAAQVGIVPVRIQLSAPAREVARGASVPIRATLKNFRNDDTAALDDVPVTLIWPATGKRARLVIPKGRSSAELVVSLSGVGLTRMEAEAPQLPTAFLLLVVRPDAAERGSSSEESRSGQSASGNRSPSARETTAAPVAPPPPPPPSSSPSAGAIASGHGSAVKGHVAIGLPKAPLHAEATAAEEIAPERIDLQVVPDDIDPAGNTWSAIVGIGLIGPRGEPVAAAQDIPVRLSARFGRVTPAATVIRRGAVAAADDVTVVADRPGTDIVGALSPVGTAEHQVRFNAPVPSKIRVEANPRDVVNDGRSAIVVTVMLLDRDNHPTQAAEADVCTTITASLGELQDRKLCIPKGDFFKETMLTSARHGMAQIVASGVALSDGQATARFLFPWLMIVLATLGGVVGGFVRSGKLWTKHLGRNLAVAAIVGVVFYALAFFGAIGAIKKLPFEIGKIAAINELGAFVLGFIGSYYQPLLIGSEQGRKRRTPPAAAAGAH